MSKTQELGYLMEEEVSLIPNLPRRVRNLALGPTTPSNALVPIFEAVYNAIHAISDRFGSDWCERGSVTIFLHNFGSDDFSVEIQDNGIGLDEENFASFRTYDSDWKSSRGGKGVGRLAWLKVFHEAHIRSMFMVKDVLFERSFDFVLDDLRPIKRMKVAPVDLSLNPQAQPGTIVILRHMRTEYVRHMPVMVDTVLRKIVAHFLPYLISANFPEIVLETRDESFNLGEFLSEKKVELGTLPVETIKGDDKGLKIVHNLLERGLVEGKASHKLYFAAHDRVVGEFDIGTTLGLTTYIEGGGNKHVYAGILSGELLDRSVNSERTSFDLDQMSIDALKKNAINVISAALGPQIERVIQQQAELTKQVVKKYPRYAYLIDNPRTFAEKKMPRHYRSAEQIYQQLALYDFRENRDIERKVEALSKSVEHEAEDVIDSGVKAILSKLSQQEYSVLADYTVKRKVVLDLLEKRLGYKPNGEMRLKPRFIASLYQCV